MTSTVYTNTVTLTDDDWFNDIDRSIYTDAINAKNSPYNAVGDGVTDDTTALDAAFATAGKIVYLPKGNYKITTNLAEPVCAGIVGDGMNFTKITAATGVTKVLSLGSECVKLKGFQIIGNATNSAKGIVVGDAESGSYWIEDVFVKSFTGSSSYGWHFYQALKTQCHKVLAQGNTRNFLIDGTGGSGITTLDFYGVGNIDATDVGMLIIHAETVRLYGGFSDSNAKEGIKLLPGAASTLQSIEFHGHRLESNWGATATEYQFVADSSSGGTLEFHAHGLFFQSSGSKSAHISGSHTAYEWIKNRTPTTAAGTLIEDSAYGHIRLHPANLPDTISDTTGLGSQIGRGNYGFPATQNASTDANTLDDYSEGTFTATLRFGGGSCTYTEQIGTYTKIGRLVFAQGSITVNTVAAPSGSLEIGILPYTSSANDKGSVSIYISGIANTVNNIVGNVTGGDTYIRVYKFSAGATANPGGDIQNGAIVRFSAIYEV